MFANGTQIGSATDNTNYSGSSSGSLSIGRSYNNLYTTGYISNLRIVKGTGVTTVTVPTAPLTAISGTSILTCQSNRFIDNSSNAFALTISGSPSVQAFSPFNPTSSWSAATNGGSGYFDGNGDYLSVADNAAFQLGSNSFCIEGWFYPTTTGDGALISKWASTAATAAWNIVRISGTLYCQVAYGSSAINATTTDWPLNQWSHIAFVRSGNTLSAYLNGTRFYTNASFSSAVNTGVNGVTVATQSGGTSYPFTGYLSGFRVVNGTAVYDPTQTTITVPTAPLTAITNTSLLLNFTNAGIYDATSKNDLETVGDARISTAIPAKWGTGSILLEGTSDRLFNGTSSPLLNLSSGNWTVECWVYFNAVAAYAYVLNIAAAPSNNSGVVLGISNTSKIYIGNGVALGTAGNTTLSTGQWYYLAWVKSGANVTMYVNGSSDVTPFAFTPNSGTYAYIGSDASAGNQLNAYIQDLRVTRGVARVITASPTAAFPTL
jgi:hypothetical protein